MPIQTSQEQGLTLLELMVAITLTALVLSTLYGVFLGAESSQRQLQQRRQLTHGMRVFFLRLQTELQGLQPSPGQEPALAYESLDSSRQPQLKLLTRSGTAAGGSDGTRRWIRYRLYQRQDAETWELWRREWPYGTDMEQAQPQQLLTGIEQFQWALVTQREEFLDHWPHAQYQQRPGQLQLRCITSRKQSRFALQTRFALPEF